MDIKTFINTLIKYSTLTLLGILLFPARAKAQTPVFPLPASQGLLANRPAACATVLQEYFATDTSTVYYSTVAGGSCTWVAIPIGSGILLQTNGTNNGSQVKLNLAAGSNITLTDGGTGTVTIAATGGGGATTPGGSANSVQYNNTTFGGVTLNATGTNEYLQQVSSGVPSFAQVAAADISGLATSATTDTTNASNISSGTLGAARLPNPSASTLGGVQSITSTSHNFLTTISTSGVPSKAQPACGDLSNAAASCSTDTTNAANISSGALPSGRMPVPSASTLGGIESFAAVTHQWIRSISTSGVPAASQPAAADLSDTATTGNYLRGNGSSFVSAVIQAGDVPTLNQNTTGTAAALSAASALPNMTTATTQAPLDNSTNVATTAYVDAAVPAFNPLTTIGDVWGGGTAGAPARIAGGLTGQALTSNNGSASAFASPGVGGRAVSGTTDTILGDSGTTLRDRGTVIQYTSGSSIATTLPQAGSSGFSSNFIYSPFQTGAGTQTITPTTSTINGQTTLQIIQNAWCSVSSPDNTNYLARCATYDKTGTGLNSTFNADGSTTFALNAALPNGETATTQAGASNDTKVATDAYVDAHFIASGTAALGTSSISSATCATVVTVSATGVASTDVIQFTPNASIKAVTGYAPSTSGGLSIVAYPTTNNVNFDVCNWSTGSITPGAVTLNWRVAR